MGMSDRIDRVLDDLVKSGAAPGVVAMVMNDRGPLYSAAAGTTGVGRSEPMTVDTMFWYASMTKALVATGGMQLVEQGRLKVDEPASNLLPELASVQVLDAFEADGAPKLRPAKRPITPRQLLTHTAGYGYNWVNGVILRYLEKYELPDLIPCKRRSLEQPLLADPGDSWEYGISIDWIGQLIEAVSGQSLRDYLRKNLFDPLGMDDTDFIQTAEQKARRATVHQKHRDGTIVPIPDHEVAQDPEFFMAAAASAGCRRTIPRSSR
jgi:methyl acetate hydrolase